MNRREMRARERIFEFPCHRWRHFMGGSLGRRWLYAMFVFLMASHGVEAGELNQNPPPDLTQLSIEDLMKIEVATVSGASRYEQKVTEAPSSVTIVTSAEIKRYGYRTLADILRSVRGFFVTYDRNYNYIGVRGFGRPGDYNSRVLLLVDGHRINDNIYDTPSIGTEFPVDVDLIDRMEVIPGPSSSLYGNNAFFGVINIITRKGGEVKGPELSGEVGSFEAYKGRLSYGNQFKNGLEVFLSGSYFHTDGVHRLYFEEFNNPSTNFGIAENRDGDQFYNLFSKLTFHDFTFEGVYGSREKYIPTASFGTVFNDPRNRTIDERGYLDLRYEHTFGNQWDVMARLYYDHADYHGDYVYHLYNSPPTTVNEDLS